MAHTLRKPDLEQQFPSFMEPGTGFEEDSFSMKQCREMVFGVIHVHYNIYHARYYFYYYNNKDPYLPVGQSLGTSNLEITF